jgi:hypothetical protein
VYLEVEPQVVDVRALVVLEAHIRAMVVETAVEGVGQEIHLVKWAWAVAAQAVIAVLAAAAVGARHFLHHGLTLAAAVAAAAAEAEEAQATKMARIKVGLAAVA